MATDRQVHLTVARVLCGELSYDDVDASAQPLVREEWTRRCDERRTSLDLAAEFRAAGRAWSECGSDGNVVLRR